MRSLFRTNLSTCLILCCLTFIPAITPMVWGQGQTLNLQPENYHGHLEIGPVAALTTDWHASPRASAIPLGTTVQFRIKDSRDFYVQWIGAREVERRGSWSIAEAHFQTPGPQVVGVRYINPYEEEIEEIATFDVIDLSLQPLRISPIEMTAEPMVFDAANPNADTMRYFFQGSSIAQVRRLAEDRYLTSSNRWMDVSVEVEPAAFAPLLEWRLNGEAQIALGAQLHMRVFPPREHRIAVGPLTHERAASLQTYLVHITSHQTDDDIPDGVPVTFTAVTEPAGHEDLITWMASTKYGHCAPLLGEGPSFTTVFDNTFGEDGQWLGVRADNAIVSQDSKAQREAEMLLAENTNGIFGYYLKRVDGPVLIALNEDFVTYPASTIKVLHHLHAIRLLQAGGVSLDGTMINVCTTRTNCENIRNEDAGCGAMPQTLRSTLETMMVNSSNTSPNALQEFFGSGNPVFGRFTMNFTGQNIVGMSLDTEVFHKFACGNIRNDPSNKMTLRDMGLLYEEVANNPSILNTTHRNIFYDLMLNETRGGLVSKIFNRIDREAGKLGLPPNDPRVGALKNGLRLAYKPGSISPRNLSIAGWVELPFDCGATSRQYVFGVFVDLATMNTVSLNDVTQALLSQEIRASLTGSLTCTP